MNNKTITLIGVILIFLAGYLLFTIKREVETLSFTLSEINKQVNIEKNTINTLKAEYVYLSSPARIRKLAAKYLNLVSIQPEQLVPEPLTQSVQFAYSPNSNISNNSYISKSHNTRSVRWRYKHMNNKYIHNTSARKSHE